MRILVALVGIIVAVMAGYGCQNEVVFPTPLPTATPMPSATPMPTATPDNRVEELSIEIEGVRLDVRSANSTTTERLRELSALLSEDVGALQERLGDLEQSEERQGLSQDTINEICDLRFKVFSVANAVGWLDTYVDSGDIADWNEYDWWLWNARYRSEQHQHELEAAFPICARVNNVWQLPPP